MRKLYVVEFNGSYTGGTMVLLCEPKEVTKLVNDGTGVDLVTDPEQIRRFRLSRMDFTPYLRHKVDQVYNSVGNGCPIRVFNKAVRDTFNRSISEVDFARRVIRLASNPRYCLTQDIKRVRLDWLIHFGLPIAEGAYIVCGGLTLNNRTADIPTVISNTYDVN